MTIIKKSLTATGKLNIDCIKRTGFGEQMLLTDTKINASYDIEFTLIS